MNVMLLCQFYYNKLFDVTDVSLYNPSLFFSLRSAIVAMYENQNLKPGLHIVVRIAKHACDDALKRILKFSAH